MSKKKFSFKYPAEVDAYVPLRFEAGDPSKGTEPFISRTLNRVAIPEEGAKEGMWLCRVVGVEPTCYRVVQQSRIDNAEEALWAVENALPTWSAYQALTESQREFLRRIFDPTFPLRQAFSPLHKWVQVTDVHWDWEAGKVTIRMPDQDIQYALGKDGVTVSLVARAVLLLGITSVVIEEDPAATAHRTACVVAAHKLNRRIEFGDFVALEQAFEDGAAIEQRKQTADEIQEKLQARRKAVEEDGELAPPVSLNGSQPEVA